MTLVRYIKKGKITLARSFKYQDISKIIESVDLSDTDRIVTKEEIEKLIEGTYPINLESQILLTFQVLMKVLILNINHIIKFPFSRFRIKCWG